jgi:iron complex outermembrane receptor protein
MASFKSILASSSMLAALLAAAPALAQSDLNSAGQTDTAPPQTEDRIIVTGRARALYRTQVLESGKLPVDPLLSTQTIQVINEQLIEDQGARDAADLYRNISGVSVYSYAGVTARGFRQEENFFDGLRGDPYAGFSVPQLFNVQRMEYLKGPAGMLYGPGAPGGLFNYITKTPSPDQDIQTRLVLGTEGRIGGAVEATGALTDRLSGRAGVFYEDRNLPRRNADSRTQIYDLGLSYALEKGEIILQATQYDQDLGGNRLRGVPTDDLGHFLTDRRWNHNEASDFLDLRSSVLQARFNYQLTPSLHLDAGLRWNDAEEVQQYHEPRGLFDSDGDGVIDSSIREFRDQVRSGDSWSFGANAIWAHRFGQVGNRLLAGMDWYTRDANFTGFSLRGRSVATPGLPTPLSLFDPDYGLTDPSTYALPSRDQYRVTPTKTERTGVYLLDEVTLGDFVFVGGARFDRFEDEDPGTGDSFSDERITWRAGGVYRLRDDVSLFLNWAESFEPQDIGSQTPLAGGPFDPTEGEIIEGGVRTELFDGRLQSSASIYQIVRTNVLQPDPAGDRGNDGVDDFIAFGEVTSEGFELDVTADITPNWVATASYAYNDTRITANAGTSTLNGAVGDRFSNAPENTFGFWTRYQVQAWNTAFALGGDYVDVRLSRSGQKVRDYLVFDASVIYELDQWRAMLRVDNLFDETYAASGFIDRTGHFPGAPRSVFVELTRHW